MAGIIHPDHIKNGVYKGLKIARRQVVPMFGDQKLRCGNCGAMGFEIHVRPVAAQARITTCVCLGCSKERKFDPNGFIEGTRALDDNVKDAREYLGKEVINK